MITGKVLKAIARWTVPWAIYERAGRLKCEKAESTRFTDEERQLLARNAELSNRHAGQRCFILATGPSIKNQNLTLLKGELCIGVSNFFVHQDCELIQPQYYCVAPYHAPISEEGWYAFLRELGSVVKNSAIFFELQDRERNQEGGFLKDKDLRYVKFGVEINALEKEGVDLTREILRPISVTVMALQVAIYMGCRKVYLLGCDHDWILHVGKMAHFYDEQQNALVRSGYNEWKESDMATEFYNAFQLWAQYKAIKKYAEEKGIRIFNSTEGGLLDVFPKVSLESVLRDSSVVNEFA